MAGEDAVRASAGRAAGVGCVMMIPGLFGGGMIAVAIAKLVGSLQRCAPEEGLPACNHGSYLIVGAICGAILLPAVVIWRMRQGAAPSGHSDRG